MKSTMRKMSYLVLTCFLLVVGYLLLWKIVLSQDEGFSSFPPEKMEEMLNRSGRARNNGHFVLSGVVVDENGQSLNGVTVELKKTKFVDIDFNKGFFSEIGTGGEDVDKPGVEREIRVVNGAFHFDLWGYCSVGLTFKPDGYYKEKLEFGAKLTAEQEQRIEFEVVVEHYEEQLKSAGLSPEQKEGLKKIIKESKEMIKDLPIVSEIEVIENNLRVVLEKQGKLTHLTAFNRGPLEYTTTGKGVVINFDKHPASSLRVIENIEDPKQLPENCVYMVADKDLDGKIATVQKFRIRKDTWGKELKEEYIAPQRVKLIMTGPESGFIRFNPDPNKKMPRQMKEAPETGYEKEIVLESDDISKEEDGSWKGVIFYFKTKDKYGKGSAGGIEISEDRSTLKIRVSFKLQPDGSRNLETGD